ncbi:hypothetical protein L4D77_07770 [Photobacterium frigidiphilum]|uniref:T1SS-143 repeat domain-containing protein n=1 Tax=Photobacterium frigidiphilum TaxID=264736 RepID=UPI003D10DA05
MDTNDTKNMVDMQASKDVAFIIKAGNKVVPIKADYQMQSDDVVVANAGAKFVVMQNGIPTIVNESCPACIMMSVDGLKISELSDSVSFSAEGASNSSFSSNDVAAIQNAILSGDDPTETLEAAAAGNEAQGSSNSRFVVIDYDNNEMLAQAGFDTASEQQETINEDESLTILTAEGGDTASISLVEGDLPDLGDVNQPSSYPVETTQSVTIEAGTQPLDPNSFTFDSLTLDSLLSELNSDITSGGESVEFVFDSATNSIIGTKNGELVLTIDLDTSTNGRDVTVDITTTLHQPIDHTDGANNSGLVTNVDDQININVSIQGTDTSNNALDNPINIDIGIADGADPSFSTDTGVTINESSQQGDVISGQIPLDVGSDEIATIVFQADQPSLTSITSNGEATTYTVSGNTITVLDSAGDTVMTVTIATDGSYDVKVTGPIDQGDSESTNIDLNVTATDKDGDTTDGAMDITITDGINATGGDQGALILNEGDLDVDGNGVGGTDTTYPASQSGSFVIKAGEDSLVPGSVKIDPSLQSDLITELQNELTSGGETLTFAVDSNGNLVGKLPSGVVAVTVSLQGEQQGQDLKVTVTITQNVPLDHNGSDGTGYVTSANDEIHINVPVQATDTDGDDLDTPANVDIMITDGANPSFGTDSGVTLNESSDKGNVISGQIPLDVGSDAIDTIVFQADQPGLTGITSNGEATTFTVSGNTITVVDSANNPVMTVTIATDGSYDVTMTGPIDQGDSESTNIDLNVTATDKDGDTADGVMDITITDGDDASGSYNGTITLTEGDLDTDGNGVGGIDTSYPATQSGNFALTAGEDRLVPDSVQVDPAQVADLMAELAAEITSGGQALTFSLNADGDIIGMLGTEVALTVKLSAVQDGQDLTVTVDIAQNVPLDHNNTGDTAGYIRSENDELHINVPVQAKDTDGDDLTTPASVGIILKDGDNPTFGTDIGVTINESSQQGNVISGQIPLDVGSDAIATIVFQADQPSLASITSNGEATTFTVVGNTLTVLDSAGDTVMTVTIATDGSYDVKVTGPIDQGDSESTNIDLNVTATDKDGDTTDGVMDITITDGINAAGSDQGELTLNEGDLDTAGDGVNPSDTDTTYPASQSGSFVIKAGEDSLVPGSVKIDPALQSDLITELQNELTSGGETLTFEVDASGNLVGKLSNGDVAVTVTLSGEQQGQDVKVTVTITQNVPLDHNGSDAVGYVTSANDEIHINVPVQATDTDGDDLDKPANVDITITDGANPSFGADSGVTIDETAQKGEVISGQIPLNVGSDAIDTIEFQSNQPSLAGITSNGQATTYTVSGNTITVVDSANNPVMTVTIATDGSYEVKVTGPIDQGDSESTNIDFNVTATDKDGDTTDGSMDITITDGTNAAGGDQGALTLNEGDLDTVGDGVNLGDTDTTYPASQSGSFVIIAGEDSLVPSSVKIDPALQSDLITELQNELTSGGEALTFEVDSNGNLVGKLPNGDVAVTVTLSGEQQGQDVKVTVAITQNVPLDHNGSNGTGYITSANDDIHINVPVQATDTDGDGLDTPANVDITITDGANPSFGADSGVMINESTDKGNTIEGQIPLDVGSDEIATIVFQASQPGLAGITSNGEATTYTVSGNTITVVDSANNPVMTVTIATDGSYDVKVTGPIDQGDSESTNIDLNVTATDKDGDTTDGAMDITITDGTNAAGGAQGAVTLSEGDLDVDGNGVGGTDTTYPASQSGSFVIKAGEDSLVSGSVKIDPALQSDLITELQNELTSGGEKLTFEVDSSGNLVGKLPNGVVAVTVSLQGEQQGQDVKVTVTITQNVPLDHNGSDDTGYVTSTGDDIHINVPVQATDTDGDDLDTPANVDITITDGANPSFGADSGVTLNESSDKGNVIEGQIPLDVGSDAIDTIVFQADQPGLTGITSNGEATTFTVSGNTITVVDSANNPVITVTIATDGSYEVKVTGPIDQGDSESTNIDLNVTATDKDGDTTDGAMDITITDGDDASGGHYGTITLTEGDLDTVGDGVSGGDTSYPATQSGNFALTAGEDRLVPDSVEVDPSQVDALMAELAAELTSGGQALTFDLNANGDIVGMLGAEVALTVKLSAVQDGQDLTVTVDIAQNVPLDHNNTGDTAGYIRSENDELHINVPVQAKDTDGDDLTTPATVGIILKDGDDPTFGTDTGVTINESSQQGDVISGQIPLDVGSDGIATIEFQSNQPSLTGITSNGQSTTYTVTGNTITVVDSTSNSVMTVTIATDGSYDVKVTGPIDQGDSESTNIDLNVTATDKDGDTTVGAMDITITDGTNAAGGVQGAVTLNEGDLDVAGDGVNPSDTDTTYPASQSGSFVIKAGEDRLVPNSIVIDPALQSDLISELQSELTSGGEKLTFEVDSSGNLVGKLPSGVVAVTVSLQGEQQGQDVKVTVTITQNVPLDHNGSNGAGYVTSAGDDIHINVPVQATDTDGDNLDIPANVDITITDGANPSFGTDDGVTINESSQQGDVISGQIPLDVGSDEIATIEFQLSQPSLASITSNGDATTYTVSGNTITVVDSAKNLVMTVTVDTDGSYKVRVTGPIDQGDSESTNIDLKVTATDKDGDTTDGSMDITITDGANAMGNDQGAVTLTEGDLDVAGDGVNPSDTDTTYPASQSGSFVIKAGEDRLDPDTIVIDPALQGALITELQNELTSGGEALTFEVDASGNLVGTLPSGTVAVTVTLSGEQQDQDVKVTVTITQNVPLDHNGTNGTGYVTSANDEIHINVPVQATDTDGDDLDTPANVDITITDGANPSFGADSGVTINESSQQGDVISGQIPLDVGSDAIDTLVFQAAQPSLAGITSNGEATTFTVVGNTLTVLDSAGDTVMTVTIATDGSYKVTVTGPIDQGDSESTNIDLNVTATDKDGDTTDGAMDITITDGTNAAGGVQGALTLNEGDLDTAGDGVNPSDTDTTYPASQSGSFVIKAGEDSLVPGSVKIDPALQSDLITELQNELTSGGETLTFEVDASGNLVGKLSNGDVAVTVTLSGEQQGQDVKVTVTITQNVPLDHNGSDGTGYITSANDDIHINVPVQATDTDGDDLDTPANVDITITDGANPSFGADSGVTVDETTQKGDVISGQIPLDVGSDAIDTIVFQADQPGLAGITSNGEATTFSVSGNTITVIDSANNPVMMVTIATDGSYEVTVTGPIDQGDSESTNINLNVTATDKDGDTTDGSMDITITDGINAAGGDQGTLTLNEGDLDVAGDGVNSGDTDTTYPASQSGSFVIKAGEDRLVPDSIVIDPAQVNALMTELASELTSAGQALTFSLNTDGDIVGMLGNTVALTVELSAAQNGQDLTVSVKITQNVPLDHNGTNGAGYVTSAGDDIHINVPVQATDTDGDDLDTPANVDITITDGANPSFGADSGVTVDETTQKGDVISGQIPLNVGSDAIDTLVFQADQPELVDITSNGLPTTYTVTGNTLTVFDSANKPVMTVTIDTDGSYKVTVTGPVDQSGASDSINVDLGVTATDKDGDTTNGSMDITITDGDDAAGGNSDTIELIEGDLDTDGNGVGGTDTSYPATKSGNFELTAGEDRLVPDSVEVDPAQVNALMLELASELTSGGQALTFSLNADGDIVGRLNGQVALTVELSAAQNGQDLTVTVDITQNVPLDHKNTGDTAGYITSENDEIHIKVPVQATDTDGDDLINPANVGIIIKDGDDPSFGTDSGIVVNETSNKDVAVEGQLNLDVGSDAIATLVFAETQTDLENLTSNGNPTTYDVVDNTITLFDSNAQPIMVITVDTDGKYTMTVTGPIDQEASLSTDLNLGVIATDKDGDSASGSMNISITDGANASGGETVSVEITEPDLSPNGYPVSAETDITLNAGEDRLDVTTVGIDATQQAALISELEAELTSGGETLAFTLENGVLVGKLPNGVIAVSVTVTAVQAGQDVIVTVKVDQLLPLDHNASGNSTGYVSENGDSIAIDVPLQGKDTDGDSLDTPAVVTVTIKDGQLPSFGVDTGISLNEETQEGQVISGSIAVDTGSDAIASIEFDDANMQSGFNGVTSNGHATTVEVNGNVLLLKDSGGKTVLEVTINNDGSYTAKITGELDQDINNLLNLPIKVTVTDDDGDTASGTINIEVADGTDATGGESHTMTAVEGDLETSTGGTTYPKTTSDSFMVTAGEDRLDPTTVNVDPVQVAALITELESELTSGGESLVFLLSADGSTLVGTTTPGGDVALTITLSGTQVGDDINVNVEFKQHLPLDHNNPTDADGFVKTNGDDITVSVPVQAKDTDGDDLDTAAKVDITIQDGADPVFGLDGGTTITETENSQTVSGAIDLDIGSDAIDKVEFDAVQASLVSLTTNGQATTYTVNGNVITVTIDGGINNGAPVLTITMNKDGTYIVKQDEPLDQDNTQGDDIGLTLGVVATDKDGDVSNSGQVIITIKDGQDATGENVTANLTVVEGDLENPAIGRAYPSTGSGSFTVEAVNDNLVSNTMRVEADVQTDLLAELNSLTSNGAPLTFMLTVDANGVITITGMTQAGSAEILEITLTPTQLANGDVSVAMVIEQSGPLDHTNGSGTYVNVGDDAITVDIPVQMTDSDGDDLEKPVSVNVTITDGDDPKFGADSTVNLEEGDDGVVSGTGQIDVDTGSDDVVKVYFDDMQSSLNGLTSNGEATTYTVSADGSTIIVTLVSDPNVVVMEATVDIDGNYTVDQKQPIDQVDDKAGDNENIILDVLADDKDGDTSAPGHINVVVNDGTNAGGGQTGTITITEGDLTPEGNESPYPVTGSTTINVPAGVDRLDPNSAEIDSDTLDALITELQNELTAGDQPITFTYNANAGTLTGVAAGVVVMTVAVDAVQAANGHDVDITITITQNQPLDHQGGNANDMVSTDGDKITIDVPVQVADTDGDKLAAGISVDVTINDGSNPVITDFKAITVDESAVNGDNKNHQGSDPSSKGEKAKGQIVVDSGSDEVTDFVIDVATFNQQNAGVLMSDGQQITLSYNSNNGKYFGKAGNTTIFVIKLSDSGKYEFILKGNVDHEEDGATDEQLTITLPVQAVDQDGDKSNTVNVPVTIKDDEPTASDVTLNTVEGRTSTLEDVLSIVGEGADDATVTALIVDGVRIPLDTLPKSGEYYQYEVKDGVTVLGILLITAEGETYFSANGDLDHAIEDITKLIDVEITDGDGDTDTSTITLEISDQDSTLTTHNSTGQEDSGSASDTIASNYHGITINMDINVGDLDRGEAVGNVTITAPTPAHGVFIYDDGNGTIITLAYTDGKVTIPAAAFELQADGVTYTLGGVTFLPDSDFSTIGSDFTIDGGKLTFDVSAEIVNSDGSTHPNMDGKFTISVDGVADIPTWDDTNTTYHYTVTEDTDNVDLNLTAVLQDDDGSNTSSEDLYYFITIKEGEGTLVGNNLVETPTGSGIYKVAAADIGSVQVDPANNFSGDIKLDVYAQSEERDNHDTADSVHKEIIINVNPDADDATMKVKRIESDEDELISLKDHIFLTPQDDNADGSEKLFVRISGLPTGAILFLDGQALVPDADGKYEVAYDEIDKLQLQPTPESNVDFTIKVEGVIKDTATVTNPDGTTTTDVVNEFVTGEQTIEVDLTGVADMPDFELGTSTWTPLSGDRIGLETTILEDGEAQFDFGVISGEIANIPDGITDTSETLSLVISNIPEGTQIVDANGNVQSLVYVGVDDQGNPKYEVQLESLNGIKIIPPEHSTKDIELDARLVVTENDGDSKYFDGELVIHIDPVVDATDYDKISQGKEDSFISINWEPVVADGFVDDQEVITGLVLQGLPDSYDLYINGVYIASGGSDIALDTDELNILLGGGDLQIKRVDGGTEVDSDVDLNLTTQVTVTQVDVDDSQNIATKTITGDIHVDIQAVVESDGILAVVDNAGQVTTVITSDANGVVDININTTGDQTFTNGLSFIEDDLSSTEVIEKVIITLVDADGNTVTEQDILDQFLVMGGINNGDGSWTVPQSELGNLQIIATESQASPVYIHISAVIRDLGDNNEGDSSSAVTKEIDTVIELDFNGSTGGVQEAGNIDVQPDIVITGTEDNHLDFGNQLDEFISVNTVGSHHENDVFTLVIDASTLPNGVSITGAEYNYETGEYVLKVPVDSEGNVDFSTVGLKLPEDFAGDFEIDVKYVTTDTVSGDVKEVSDTIPVQVSPVVDIPSNSQTGDHTPEVVISVVDIDAQGVSTPATAYEDGDITLDLSVVLADSSTSLNEGLETVTSVTLTVDSTKGFFVAADGSLVSEITLPASELSNIQFRPVEDFSGSVSVGVKVDITDTANFDQTGGSATDIGSYTTDVSFDVVAVNDAVNWTGPEKVVGQEDAGGVSLAGIGGTIVDIDGSEQILSIKLTGVPEGFIIDGAVNNSNGEWSISLPPGQTTFNLDNIKVIPPEDFSGEVELNVVVYSKEDSLTEVAENSTSITIDVQPVADRVDTDVETKASGTENDTAGIDLILNIEAFDDQNSYGGSASNVTEKGPEGLQITLTNVPESSSIALPDGVAGTVANMGGGVWIVTVESSDLDKLIFHPGDANNVNWNGNIDVDIRAVDNGVVADNSIAVDETIHIDVEADNDAPVNVLPNNLTADEDVPLLINSLKVVDVDANETANGEMTVTLNVGDGTLNIPDSFNWAALGLQVTGEESDTLIISGSLDDINALLASGVEYTGDTNFNGDDTLTMTTNDQANSGTGPAEGLTDSDSITITVNPVNDAPVNTVPNAVTAEEDGSTVITGMQISDVDFGEAGTTGSMSVTLNVAHGILSVDIPVGSSVVVTGQGTDTVMLSGLMDDINALLNNGVTYEGDDNYSGADELTMTTHDGGNVGSGTNDTAISKVPVTVTPKADAPTLSLDNSFIQTAAIRGSLGTMIPLLGLIAVLTDTDGSETLSIMVKNLAGADLVNSNGDVIAGNQGNGTWIITKEDLADLNVIGLPEGVNNLEVVAVSEETDGSKAESATVDINVVVDNLANTGNQIGGSSSSDAANLVIDSSAEATLLGGDGNDILIGGAASDILVGGAGDDIMWGGEQGGAGDGVEDIFKWQAGDFGTATNVATDTIMDFEVGIDKIDLTDAFSAYDSMSLSDLTSLIKLTGNGADSTLEIYDAQGDLVQNIVINGVSETALLGNDPAGMSDEDKLGTLLNSGQLDVANNFGDAGDNILVADNSGENLYGFDGNDVLTGGAGNDFLTGGEGNNLFTWDDTLSNEDVITDFKLDQDQLDLSQILSDGGDDKFDMDDLLGHVTSGDLTASFDNDGKVNLSVTNSDSGNTQSIVLENIDSASLGDVSQADILNQLFSHDAFKVDPNL